MSLINEALKRAEQDPASAAANRASSQPSAGPGPIPQPSPSRPEPASAMPAPAGRRVPRSRGPIRSLLCMMLALSAFGLWAVRASDPGRVRQSEASPAERAVEPANRDALAWARAEAPSESAIDEQHVEATGGPFQTAWAAPAKVNTLPRAVPPLTLEPISVGVAGQTGQIAPPPAVETLTFPQTPPVVRFAAPEPAEAAPHLDAVPDVDAARPASPASDAASGVTFVDAADPASADSPIARFKLMGIMRVGDKSVVTINGRTLQEGDRIDGLRVKTISPRTVEVELNGQCYTLGL